MATLFDIVTRHQIYLEGIKNGFGVDFERNVAYELNRELRKLFSTLEYENLGDMTKKELNLFLKELVALNKRVFGKYTDQIINAIYAFMIADRELSEIALAEDDDEAAWLFSMTNERLWSLIVNDPMGATGVGIIPTLLAFASMAGKGLENSLSKAWVNAENTSDYIQSIIGTKSGSYLDGDIGKIVRQNRSIVGTVLQHVSSEVQHSIGKSFYDEYMWSSIIDNSTTNVCRDRNGNIYQYGRGPVPPAHIGCRSKIVPISKHIPTNVPASFADWVGTQPSAFLRDAFVGKPSEKVFPPLTIRQFTSKFKNITS